MPLVEAGGTGATAGTMQYGHEAGVATTPANLTLRTAKEGPRHRDNRNMMAAAQEAAASVAVAVAAAATTTATTGATAVGKAETQPSMATQAATGSEATAAAVAATETTGTAGTDTGTSPQGEDRHHETSQAKKKKKKKRGGKAPRYNTRTPGHQRNQKRHQEQED